MIAQEQGRKPIAQSGVIPYRIRRGQLEVALVTASAGPHWTVPKGHVEPELSPEVESRCVGSYVYEKRGKLRHVDLYPLAVSRELKSWPEMLLRKRRWMSAEEAASRVRSAELRCCIQKFERSVSRMMKRERAAAAA
jgi:hypothetical protein